MPETPNLDWSKTGTAGEPSPCSICGRPAICRSPRDTAVHKTCAETWTANQPRRGEYGRAA